MAAQNFLGEAGIPGLNGFGVAVAFPIMISRRGGLPMRQPNFRRRQV
ncbi:MAG: hypothetical protein U0350_09465 [Caldilineaceae bacterium]